MYRAEKREFTKDIRIDSIANGFLFDLEYGLKERKLVFPHWNVYANKKEKSTTIQNTLIIQFSAHDRTTIDMLALELEVMKKYYSFEFGFINPSTHSTRKNFKSADNKGELYIKNIKLVKS